MIHYNETAIERTCEWLVEKAMKKSTSPRIAGHLLEAAETIVQLRKELNEAKAAEAEVREQLAQSESGEIDGKKILNDLTDALDELWKQKAKLYDTNGGDYLHGQMNVIRFVQRAIEDVRSKHEPLNDLREWVRLMEEELEEE